MTQKDYIIKEKDKQQDLIQQIDQQLVSLNNAKHQAIGRLSALTELEELADKPTSK